jgi:DNA (cytosine-5)-methyltransferase 1
MNGLDLFSGYGGISLALLPWVRPIAYCEREKYCQGVLLSRMAEGLLPRAPIWDDVRTLDGKQFRGIVDIVYGGFPCQDLSVAGRGRGLEGERSGLFFEIMRLAEEIQSPFIFIENVPGIRTRGLDVVVRELATRGYDCRWDTLSAHDVGAPHLRKRWFLLGYAKHYGRSSPSNGRSARKTPQLSSEKRENPICKPARTSRLSCDVSNTIRILLRDEQRRRCGTCGEGKAEPRNDGETRLMADTSSERLEIGQGKRGDNESQFTTPFGNGWWSAEPPVGRVADRSPHRVDEIRALGNGVVPLQVRTAFQRLLGIEESSPASSLARR